MLESFHFPFFDRDLNTQEVMPHFGQVDGKWTKVLLDLLICLFKWQPPSRDSKIPQRNMVNILYCEVHGLLYGWFMVLLKLWLSSLPPFHSSSFSHFSIPWLVMLLSHISVLDNTYYQAWIC
jgi:hypothetical protein